MTKEDVITTICRSVPYSRAMVTTVVDAVLYEVSFAVSKGESVQLSGFGTFEPKQRAARTGRNPRTNEPVPIPARVVPNFRASKAFKDAVINR